MPDITPDLLHLDDDGTFPNNRLPVLLWRDAVPTDGDTAVTIEDRVHTSGWGGSWRNGIFAYHHYHSTAHEVLGIARGSVTVQLGGPNGETLELNTGDIALLPAGTGHCNLGQSSDLLVVGAYPPDQRPDLLRGEPGERPKADQAIANVPLTVTDPVTGEQGGPEVWRNAGS